MANKFITADELKAYPLPVTTAQWGKIGDDQLEIIIGYASERIEDWLDRRLINGNYVERRYGSDLPSIILNNYPITALNGVSSYTSSGAYTSWDTSLFRVNATAGIVEFNDAARNAFSKGLSWVFDYDAGYDEVPGVVKHATALQTVEMLQPIFRGGREFQEVELITELDEQIVDLLDKYKRRRMG